MPFDMQVSGQVIQTECIYKAQMYEYLHEAAKKTEWIKLTGVFVGMSDLIMGIISIVAALGELIIKGLGNIFGSLCYTNCSFSKGCKQIFFYIPLALSTVLLFPIVAVIEIVKSTFGLLHNPQEYSLNQAYELRKKVNMSFETLEKEFCPCLS